MHPHINLYYYCFCSLYCSIALVLLKSLCVFFVLCFIFYILFIFCSVCVTFGFCHPTQLVFSGYLRSYCLQNYLCLSAIVRAVVFVYCYCAVRMLFVRMSKFRIQCFQFCNLICAKSRWKSPLFVNFHTNPLMHVKCLLLLLYLPQFKKLKLPFNYVRSFGL